jgi:hypothetical protein
VSGAPLSAGAWEILRALVLGVQIRQSDAGGWRTVEPWHQDSEGGSLVDASHIGELISCGFIVLDLRGSQSFAVVSETGSKALGERSAREIKATLRSLNFVKLKPKTCF